MAERSPARYGPLLATYVGLTASLAATIRWRGRVRPPEPADVLLLGVATFKLSRLITKEKVLQGIRDPFIEEVEPGAGSELNCQPSGTGVRRAVGELLTCPFCISVWIATFLTGVYSLAPRAVRLAASGLAAVVVADTSQYAYSSLREAAE